MEAFQSFLEIELFNFKEHSLTVLQLMTVIVIFIITKAISIVLRLSLFKEKGLTRFQKWNTNAIYQLSKYLLWVISITYMLEALGIELSILLAGSAALLVGVGLGLQQMFNDVLSGLVLQFEQSVKVNDILEIDGDVVRIQEIGFRTSLGLTRSQISVILPNSVITSNKVINWNNQSDNTRFGVNVSVAYGSNVEEVISVLESCALEHVEIDHEHMVEARLMSFGNSSLDFRVLFFSNNIFEVERIKSDVRRIINKRFLEKSIQIPFPQLDVHMSTNIEQS